MKRITLTEEEWEKIKTEAVYRCRDCVHYQPESNLCTEHNQIEMEDAVAATCEDFDYYIVQK